MRQVSYTSNPTMSSPFGRVFACVRLIPRHNHIDVEMDAGKV